MFSNLTAIALRCITVIALLILTGLPAISQNRPYNVLSPTDDSQHSFESIRKKDPFLLGFTIGIFLASTLEIQGVQCYEVAPDDLSSFYELYEAPSQTILLFQDAKGLMTRLNLAPLPIKDAKRRIGGEEESIKRFNLFLECNGMKGSRLSKDALAKLFIATVCHEGLNDYPDTFLSREDLIRQLNEDKKRSLSPEIFKRHVGKAEYQILAVFKARYILFSFSFGTNDTISEVCLQEICLSKK